MASPVACESQGVAAAVSTSSPQGAFWPLDAAPSRARQVKEPERGEVVGRRFLLESRIARGGMGVVFRARDRATRATVALKVRTAGDPARIEREAAALRRLRHPAIVRYVAYGRRRTGEPFLAMEWVDGVELRERLAQGTLGLEDTRLLALRIADALAVAHAEGIVHRDVTPRNVLLCGSSPSGAKLVDFGLAYIDTDSTLTGARAVGTFGYVAPEADGRDPVTPRLDVYSFGCLLFECLVGHAPYLPREIVGDETPREQLAKRDVPEDFAALVLRMIAIDPEERPRDGAAVLAALRALRPSDELRGEQAPSSWVVVVAQDPDTDSAHGRPRALAKHDELRRLAQEHGGRILLLVGDLVAVGLPASAAPLEVATCAEAVAALLPGCSIGVASCEVAADAPRSELVRLLDGALATLHERRDVS
jgi:hypothetical protein